MFESKVRSTFGILGACGAILMLLVESAGAQVLYGSLVGNVKDASGAAVAGAVVQAIQEQTQVTRHAVTDATGQ
ncbi:MAG TPA: hypothetical protein VJ323_02480, partial [Bryobacteraceae bacterium]|nr:hypothetical protein [Bryobacteraceae bacterium]